MDFITENITVIAIIAIILVVLAIFGFIASRIKRVPPNQALVIVGRGAGSGGAKTLEPDGAQRVVIGGRVFIWPIVQQGFSVSLEQCQIAISLEGVDKNFIKLAIQASVNFKVSGTAEGVRRAAQRFLIPAGIAQPDHLAVPRRIAPLDQREHAGAGDHLQPHRPLGRGGRGDEGRPRRAGPPGRPARHLRHLHARHEQPGRPRPCGGGRRGPARRRRAGEAHRRASATEA